MKNVNEESLNRILNELFGWDKELFDSAMKVFDIIRDFVDLVNDKYPGTTSQEVATVGMQLFWDSCQYQNMNKSEIMALATNILKEM
ncbi:MAG: hypothetical protein U0L04_12730 [Bacteroidaceae bacterium]|nr:hypothetical protein [Bacteroidaceae bacterium]